MENNNIVIYCEVSEDVARPYLPREFRRVCNDLQSHTRLVIQATCNTEQLGNVSGVK